MIPRQPVAQIQTTQGGLRVEVRTDSLVDAALDLFNRLALRNARARLADEGILADQCTCGAHLLYLQLVDCGDHHAHRCRKCGVEWVERD